MAIDEIHKVFPGAPVSWQRTPRVATPRMRITVDQQDLLTLLQQDMSDDLRGPGVEELQQSLKELKESRKEA